MTRSASLSESDILADIIDPDHGDLSREVAKSLLRWKFTSRAIARMNRLANRNSKGTITERERQELEKFVRVGAFINIVQAKARLSLGGTKLTG